MERALKSYIEEVKSEVSALVYSDGEGTSYEDKFTEYCLEILESIGKTEGARVLSFIHPNSRGQVDWKINGYCLKDQFKDGRQIYFETLELFITYYKKSYDYKILSTEFTKSINQIKKFINGSLKRHIDYIDSSNTELNELLKIIGQQSNLFDRINIHLLINGTSNQNIDEIKIKGINENIKINVNVWDIPRFFRINETNSTREPIEIDFKKYIDTPETEGIQCLEVPNLNGKYDCYLAIIPGEILAKLYKEFSNELLESNVRAFLGQAGKFNKGIRDTIRDKPHMFLPYNNGITATASEVKTVLKNNSLLITSLKDFQIVNGGQTTASLYHTQKKHKVSLSDIFVQMKLTVINDIEVKNIEVPNIARYANSQNKVSELDLSSNNPFFVQIESLSRKQYVKNPENPNQSLLWFFERVKGQYRETINKLTPALQRKFKEQNPTKLKFVKSDISKYMNLWSLKPFMVSRGSQKNFIDYTKEIKVAVDKNKLPKENFYKKLIANAIIFRSVDKLFGRKNANPIGDTNLKSFSVSYTISYFHFLTNNKLNLWQLYIDQKINPDLLEEFRKLLIFVYNHLINNAVNTLISEYAKKENSWEKLKEENYIINSEILDEYLISDEEFEVREKEVEATNESEDNINSISKINKMGLKFWDGLKEYSKNNSVSMGGLTFLELFDLVSKIKQKRNLNSKDIKIGLKGLEFINNNLSLLEDVKKLSKESDGELLEIKAVYDRIKLFTAEERQKIIALGEQTKTFSYQETSNIKLVFRKMKNNEKIRERSLIKSVESIKKLKKFGIKW